MKCICFYLKKKFCIYVNTICEDFNISSKEVLKLFWILYYDVFSPLDITLKNASQFHKTKDGDKWILFSKHSWELWKKYKGTQYNKKSFEEAKAEFAEVSGLTKEGYNYYMNYNSLKNRIKRIYWFIKSKMKYLLLISLLLTGCTQYTAYAPEVKIIFKEGWQKNYKNCQVSFQDGNYFICVCQGNRVKYSIDEIKEIRIIGEKQ